MDLSANSDAAGFAGSVDRCLQHRHPSAKTTVVTEGLLALAGSAGLFGFHWDCAQRRLSKQSIALTFSVSLTATSHQRAAIFRTSLTRHDLSKKPFLRICR